MPTVAAGQQLHRTRAATDICIVAGLLLLAVVLVSPLFDADALLYIDNAVHVAEVRELAAGRWWSELSFCGFPLFLLHSPLWYGLLAGLVAFGLPLIPLYLGAIVLGMVTPSLAIYAIGRRHHRATAAAGAYLYLVLPTNTVGYSAATGGMWTFHLGTALLVLLVGELRRGSQALVRPVRFAALSALIGLTHHFVLVGAVLLILMDLGLRVRGGARLRDLGTYAIACGAAALASAAYWAPTLVYTSIGAAGSQNLSLGALLARVLLPTNAVGLVRSGASEQAIRLQLHGTDIMLFWSLLALAGWAGWRSRGRREHTSVRLLLGWATLILALIAASRAWPNPALGPVGWRMVSFFHLGLALAVATGPGPRHTFPIRRSVLIGCIATAVASGFWWSLPLARAVDREALEDVPDLRATLAWVGANGQPSWGRVLLQDLFTGWNRYHLGMTHAPIVARSYTSLPLLGTYYGIVPYTTASWADTSPDQLLGEGGSDPTVLAGRLKRAASRAIVLSEDRWRTVLAEMPGWSERWRRGRFSVWVSSETTPPHWARSAAPGTTVLSSEYHPAHIRLDVEVTGHGRAVTAVAFHPLWRVVSPRGVSTRSRPDGLMELTNLPPGRGTILLEWSPPLWPFLLTVAGWLLIGAWAARTTRRVAG